MEFPKLATAPDPADIYMFKVNNRNTRTRCEIRSKLTIKTPERRHGGMFMRQLLLTRHIIGFILSHTKKAIAFPFQIREWITNKEQQNP